MKSLDGARTGPEFFRREGANAYDIALEDELVKVALLLEDVADHFIANPVMSPRSLITKASRMRELSSNGVERSRRAREDEKNLETIQRAAMPAFDDLPKGLGLEKLNDRLLDANKIKMWGDQAELEAYVQRLREQGYSINPDDLDKDAESVNHDTKELYLNRYLSWFDNVPDLMHGLTHLQMGNKGISREVTPMQMTKRISSFYRDLGKPVRTFDYTLLDILQESANFKNALNKLKAHKRAGYKKSTGEDPVYQILNAQRYYIGVMLGIAVENHHVQLKDTFMIKDDLFHEMFAGAITPKEITHEVRKEAAKSQRNERAR